MHEVLRWATATFYTVALTVLMLKQFAPRPAPFPQADKVAHFFLMGLLGVLLMRAMTPAHAERPSRFDWTLAWTFSIGYAVAIEFIQPHFHRSFEVMDMVAGAFGIIALTIGWARLRPYSVFVR
jgi:VanZ family protein